MEQIQKIKFLLEKKPTILLVGEKTEILRKLLDHLLLKEFGEKKDLMIIESPEEKVNDFKFYLQKTELGIVVVKDEVKKFNDFLEFLKDLPPKTNLVFNFEEKNLKRLKDLINLHMLSFGIEEKADVFVSNLKFNSGMNFKISFGGATVPFWLEGVFGKEYIFSLLGVVCCAILFGINLVEISQHFKDFEGVSGKKRLMEGISGSFLLDDSASFEFKEQKESLEILKEIHWAKRKICVLDSSFEKEIIDMATKIADLIFIFGDENLTEKEKILIFDKIEAGTEKLKEILRENDLVLILGSQKFNFEYLLDNLRKIW